jgi:hypothetical protein
VLSDERGEERSVEGEGRWEVVDMKCEVVGSDAGGEAMEERPKVWPHLLRVASPAIWGGQRRVVVGLLMRR